MPRTRTHTCVLSLNGSVSWRSAEWDRRWNQGRPVRSRADVVEGLAHIAHTSASEISLLFEEALRSSRATREFDCSERAQERRCTIDAVRSQPGLIINIFDSTREWSERRQRSTVGDLAVAMVELASGEARTKRWLEILNDHFEATISTSWALNVGEGALSLRHVLIDDKLTLPSVAVATRITDGVSLARAAWFGSTYVVAAHPLPEDQLLIDDLFRSPEPVSGWALPFGGRGPESGVFVFYRRGPAIPSMESVERLLNILQPTGETHQTERAPETDPVVRAARSDSTLLLLGETGSGKTQLARKIHEASDRAKYPFVELNCAGLNAALVESELFGHERGSFTGAAARKVGLLEAANGGTVFLDEVGELDLLVQAKLLKVLETHRLRRVGGNAEVSVDFRLMCATHRDLRQEAAAGRFRPDLYFRIHVLQINVAPLRSRPWDIAPLANELLVGLREVTRSPNLRLGDDVAGALLGYSWPGNVRELRNVLERAASLADDGLVSAAHLLRALEASEEPRAAPRPSWPQPSPAESPFDAPTPVPPTNVSLRDTERRVILEAFEKTGRNLSEAARVLSMPRTTLRAKLRRFGVL